MPYQPTTNFRDSNGVDLGKKLVTKDYLLTVYESLVSSIGNSGLTVTPALWTWGRNAYGQLGINNTTQKNTPVTTFAGGTNWKSVACSNIEQLLGGTSSSNHTAAIKTDGTLWIWGTSGAGQLGINLSSGTRNTPVTTFAGGNDWKSVACGSFHTAAIKTDGTLWLWGSNSSAPALGNNSAGTNINTPITTFAGGNNWKQVSGGDRFTAAIKTDGTLWTWGKNSYGNLGINNTSARSTPVTTILGGTNWKSLSCGPEYVLAIKTDGTLWTWGRNNAGQLGDNTTTNRNTPVTTFAGGTNWKQVSGGGNEVAAIKTDGTLWTWGSNTVEPALGINSAGQDRLTPVTTFAGGTNWKYVSSGNDSMAAIKTDGSLWVWGLNSQGELGINNTSARSTPVTTSAGGNNWKSVAAGYNFVAAILSDDYI